MDLTAPLNFDANNADADRMPRGGSFNINLCTHIKFLKKRGLFMKMVHKLHVFFQTEKQLMTPVILI